MGRTFGRVKGIGQIWQVFGLLIFAALSACDAGPSAVLPDGQGAAPAVAAEKAPLWAEKDSASRSAPVTPANAQSSNVVKGDGPPPPQGLEATSSVADAGITETRYHEWPLWSYNRQYKAAENAQYHFEKHGPEFGAKSYEDWLAKVHGFIHSPPKGTQTIPRNNGDTLFYHAASNTFAVMTKRGAPRTMFKPDNGAAYWQKQKEIEAGRRTIRDRDE
jgi:pyocin large subunit-like protein